MHTTRVRIDDTTHRQLKRLAAELDTTLGNAIAVAVRCLRQVRIGEELTAPMRDDEALWLGADPQ